MKKIFSHLEIPQVNYLDIQNQDLSDDKVKNNLSVEIIGFRSLLNKSRFTNRLEMLSPQGWAIEQDMEILSAPLSC